MLLIGLPGSGKTSVGRQAARLLGVPLVDVDQVIAESEGTSITAIFSERGEAAFRELETDQMGRVLAGPPVVVAPGGGWAAQRGNLEGAAGRALVIYLQTDAATAHERVKGEEERPLLSGARPLERMRELYTARHPIYQLAETVVDTAGKTVEQVAHHVVELARSRGGW